MLHILGGKAKKEEAQDIGNDFYVQLFLVTFFFTIY